NQEHRLLVSQLSALLRLAVALDRRHIGAIRHVKSDYRSDDKALYLDLVPALTNDDCALELWNLDYKKSVFEEEFGVKVVARLASKSSQHY
ncbi:MAG: Ppx/GppA family phosphatase, partial [Moorea sp. SIO3E2]|nr:Ppx/GppA family phosphatase [Moorena sp. SIO3E2]